MFVNDYSLSNIIFRINIALDKINVAKTFDPTKFVWTCYLFVRGRYCKFTIKIYRHVESNFFIDIDKIDNNGFIFREWIGDFKRYFKNVHEIPLRLSNILTDDYKFETNTTVFDLYVDSLTLISTYTFKEDTLGCIDYLVEIIECSHLHSHALNCGIHFKLCYLLMELEFDKDESYAVIDTVLYILYLLSMGSHGKNSLSKCRSLLDFLNRTIHQDLKYYQIYTLELSQAILSNIV